MNYGYVEVTVKNNILGSIESRTFKWVGGVQASLSFNAFREDYIKRSGNFVFIGPYRCMIVDQSFSGFELIRVDNGFTWLLVFLHIISKYLRIVYSRLIITCAVWGLAEFHEGQIPSYLDLYVVKWFKKVLSLP